MEHHYYATVIAAASDSPATHSTMPQPRGAKKTVAEVQYEMLADHPFEFTQPDVLFNSWLQRQDFDDVSDDEVEELREKFFSKEQPCLRASPLPKKFGWGFIFDEEGKLALVGVESEEYKQALEDGKLKVVNAMRSSRK